MPNRDAPSPFSSDTLREWVLIAAVLVIGLTLRTPVTSLGVLLSDVSDGLGLSSGMAGVLTSAPTLLFALSATAVPALYRRLPSGPLVTGSLIVLAVGTAGRVLGGVPGMAIGTVLAMVGIGVLNVALPVIVDESFPKKNGLVTGLYVAMLQIGATVASFASVPLANGGEGWRTGLAWWAVIPVVAIVVWVSAGRAPDTATTEEATETPSLTWRSLFTDRTAVALMLFFGVQAGVAFATMGWLATIYRDAGLTPDHAGNALAVSIAVQIPMAVVFPPWVAARTNKRWFLPIFGVPYIIGFAGLLLAPATIPSFWAACVGVGLGSFPISLMLIGMRSPSAKDTPVVSAFVQSLGFIVAIPGPLLFGVLRDATGSWTVPLAVALFTIVLLAVTGWMAAEDRTIGD